MYTNTFHTKGFIIFFLLPEKKKKKIVKTFREITDRSLFDLRV